MGRASNQFDEDEVRLMAAILEGVSCHRIDRDWAIDKKFASVARKVVSMKATVKKPPVTCEDCGEETRSGGRGVRRTCNVCKKKLCGYCHHHFHKRNEERLSSSG